MVYLSLHQTDRAVEFYEISLSISSEAGDRSSEAVARFNLSAALNQLGDREQAIMHLQAALAIFEQVGDPDAEIARERLTQWNTKK